MKEKFTCYEFCGIILHKNFFGEIPGKRAGGTLKKILGNTNWKKQGLPKNIFKNSICLEKKKLGVSKKSEKNPDFMKKKTKKNLG